MSKDMVDFYVTCIRDIDGFMLENVPPQRQQEVLEELEKEEVE